MSSPCAMICGSLWARSWNTIITPASSRCPRSGWPGSRTRRSWYGARSRARCARRHASTAIFSCPPIPPLSMERRSMLSAAVRISLRRRPMCWKSASVFRNLGEGNARGIETWASWNASRAWRLSGGLVAQRIDTELKPGSLDTSSATGLATNDPSQYWMLRSSYDISEQLEFDATLRHVGALPKPLVPSYYEMDMRLGWKPQRNLELAIIGQNLLHSSHPEFGTDPARSLIERSVMLQAVLHY